MVLLMDVGKAGRSGSVSPQKSAKSVVNIRSPLVLSEKNNATQSSASKLRTRETTSRYKSSTPTVKQTLSNSSVSWNRSPSMTVSRTISTSESQSSRRSLSTERRLPTTTSSSPCATQSSYSRCSTSSSPSRPCTPARDTVAEMHVSSKRLTGHQTKDGLWPSIRGLSSSLNLGSVSHLVSGKHKGTSKSSMNLTSERKRTPLGGRNASDQLENSKPLADSHLRGVDQRKRSGILGKMLSAGALTRSVDLMDRPSKTSFSSISSRETSLTRKSEPYSPGSPLQKSINDSTRRMPLDGIGKSIQNVGSNLSLSSNSTKSLPCSRTQSLTTPGLHRPSSPSKYSLHPSSPNKYSLHPSSPSKYSLRPSSPSKLSLRSSSPGKSLARPPSPSRTSLPSATSSRSASSPSRTRTSTSSTSSSVSGTSSSVVSYIVDVRKGKKNGNHVENVYQLKLLYNGYLQWRFVNARAEAALSKKKMISKNSLNSVWMAISKLLDSTVLKRINLQKTRQETKLHLILKEQITHLEEWALLEREHCKLLSGAAEALKASIICIPVTGKADILDVKDAISSVMDVMQVMGSSICYLLSMMESRNSLLPELANVAAKGRAMLNECRDLLALTAAMQVEEFSLRTHLLQLKQEMTKVG